MSIYDELKPIASELIKEFKQGEIKLIQITPGNGPAYNPGAPTETITDLDATARGVSFTFVQSGLAVASDLTVTCAVVDGIDPPAQDDFVTIDGVRHKIISILPSPAAGTKVVWKFIVRRGG